jgi:hypothetical protein
MPWMPAYIAVPNQLRMISMVGSGRSVKSDSDLDDDSPDLQNWLQSTANTDPQSTSSNTIFICRKGMVSAIDNSVARIIAKLKETG